MNRLFIQVEGPTEEDFVNEVLRRHLVDNHSYHAVDARIVGNFRLREKRGSYEIDPGVRGLSGEQNRYKESEGVGMHERNGGIREQIVQVRLDPDRLFQSLHGPDVTAKTARPGLSHRNSRRLLTRALLRAYRWRIRT